MERRIYIRFQDEEFEAVRILATRERRDARDQVAVLVRERLVDLGLLPRDLRRGDEAREEVGDGDAG